MASRLSKFEGGSLPRGQPESIQVTARIVRDPMQPFPRVPELKADPADFEPLDLKKSPLVVDHRKSSPVAGPAILATPELPVADSESEPHSERRLSIIQRRFSKGRRSQSQDRAGEVVHEIMLEADNGNRPRRRSSLTIVRDFIKDRRDSLLLGVMSPANEINSTSPNSANLASPAIPSSTKSPSRPPSTHQNSFLFNRRLSGGSRRSSLEVKSPAATTTIPVSESPSAISIALSPSPMTDPASIESDVEDGKATPVKSPASRASRFMRRLSASLSNNRKTSSSSANVSPTLAEEDEFSAQSGVKKMTSTSSVIAYMGDVNVQFPDTLLWKRRSMSLDAQGFLILSAVPGAVVTMPAQPSSAVERPHQAGGVKRYHLSDFRRPYTPDVEVQELPNSVVLDFIDGSGIQIACEDRAGQMHILHCKLAPSYSPSSG